MPRLPDARASSIRDRLGIRVLLRLTPVARGLTVGRSVGGLDARM